MNIFIVVVLVFCSSSVCGELFFAATDIMINRSCPVWQERKNTTGNCVCIHHQMPDFIYCYDGQYYVELPKCFCMTYTTSYSFGSCQYSCIKERSGLYYTVRTDNESYVNHMMCGTYGREGQMCGQCKPGYAPPVYSYSLSCVNCTTSNWGKYTAVSLLPLTAFFAFVVTFRISATSPVLHGYVMFVQIVFCPPIMRLIYSVNLDKKYALGVDISMSVVGIWNLDFFRVWYTTFCFHPHTNTLQVLALDYLIAVYPLLLIGLSYLLVLLYDHNVRLVVFICKPFVFFFIRFRRQWNIRTSLVDAFATFLLLSYIKILSVSVDLLMPLVVYHQNGTPLTQLYLFNQGDVAYFSSQHLPYACLALFFLLTFTLLPMALLFLYPCSCFQVCLNRTGLSCQSLHIFMDSFQGHLKNGTNGTRDFRSFSAIHLLFRVVVYISLMFAYQVGSYASTSIIVLCFTAITALAQPYKRQTHNFIEVFCLVMLTFATLAFLPQSINNSPLKRKSLMLFNFILIVFLVMYQPTIVILLVKPWKLVSQVWLRMQLKIMTTLPNRQGYGRLLN